MNTPASRRFFKIPFHILLIFCAFLGDFLLDIISFALIFNTLFLYIILIFLTLLFFPFIYLEHVDRILIAPVEPLYQLIELLHAHCVEFILGWEHGDLGCHILIIKILNINR